MLLDKHYSPKSVEPKWQKFWEKRGIYKFNRGEGGSIFSIDTPPPYVSSAYLHVGHAMSYVQAEIIVRYWRMKGYNIFYPMGFDDNGLPTERYVEEKYNIDKSKISRSEFIKLCLKETALGIQVYEKLWRSLGIGVDWSLSYNTIGTLAQKIAQRSFIDLYRNGWVYREDAPSFWCPQCGTALAQADLEDFTEESFLYDIEFKLEDGTPLVISTTRPEFIPACVALYINPGDKRYSHLMNKVAFLPIFNQSVPIKTSQAVEIEKGTGLMMVCTWGDVEDIRKWKEDKLETKLLIDRFGKLTDLAGKYQGLSVVGAREAILVDLKKEGLLKSKSRIQHVVNIHERCGTPVEFFSSPQWFIKLINLKNDFLHQGNELKWYPRFMQKRYEDWVSGLKWDWSISRNRYYGVPFPVWYCHDCGEVILPKDEELPVDPHENQPKNKSCSGCGSKKFVGESDVMDTWMTSSLTPLINAKWGEKNNLMEKIYPMSLRVQGFEIIRTWLFYTIVKSYLHTNSLPWKAAMISGWGLDSKGKKMSKSKGNFVTPEEMIEKYSADALRLWSCGASLGMDLRFSEEDVKAGQKLLTKFWNATRFILMNLTDYDYKEEDITIEETDKWILAELQKVIKDCTRAFESYEYAQAKIALEHFFWNKFTDNYLEICKDRLHNPEKRGKEVKRSAQFTLFILLNTLIKLFAPILPYITEEIYQMVFKKKEGVTSVHLTKWPKVDRRWDIQKLREKGRLLTEVIFLIRKFRTENKIFGKRKIKVIYVDASGVTQQRLKEMSEDIKGLAQAETLSFLMPKKQDYPVYESFKSKVKMTFEI